jgi:formylmethanofuran dehydrogenase subunit B
MEKLTQAGGMDSVTCPACGLLCDDLVVDRDAAGNLTVGKGGCARSIAFFQRPRHKTTPRIEGKPADLQSAIKRAADILRNTNQPLIAGLGTEVQGMRAVMSLADRIGATLDHMNSKGSIRNTLVLQNSGWHVATLTEVRNRVDVLLVIGTDIVSHNPRFFERIIWNQESMFGQDTAMREVIYLGGRNLDTSAGVSPKGILPTVLPCDIEHLPEVMAVLHALISGKELQAEAVAGIAVADLKTVALRLQAATYSVVTWAPAMLDFPHAELAIQNITQLIATLNTTTRSSGLPLGGSDGDTSANQVSTWISGYPVRNSFRQGYPEYDPFHFSTDRQLQDGEADALVWISTFNPERLPPKTNILTIVIGHANMKLAAEPEVFIPVAIPGIDHTGTMFRIDSVVSLPLGQLRESALPNLREVLMAIEDKVGKP